MKAINSLVAWLRRTAVGEPPSPDRTSRVMRNIQAFPIGTPLGKHINYYLRHMLGSSTFILEEVIWNQCFRNWVQFVRGRSDRTLTRPISINPQAFCNEQGWLTSLAS